MFVAVFIYGYLTLNLIYSIICYHVRYCLYLAYLESGLGVITTSGGFVR